MAFAIKFGGGCVTLVLLWRGAINQGAFHEALNLAALYKLPTFHLPRTIFSPWALREEIDLTEKNCRSHGGYDIPEKSSME